MAQSLALANGLNWAFVALLATGGVAGFVVKGSKMSLIMGTAFAGVIGAATWTNRPGLAAAAAAALVFRFGKAVLTAPPPPADQNSTDGAFSLYYKAVFGMSILSCGLSLWTALADKAESE